MGVGLYIHVPFCRTRCHFCAFYLQIHREDRALAYLEALAKEIRLHAELDSLKGRSPDTLYFGGGTPTTLSSDQLGAIVDQVRHHFGLQKEAEITVEAHPDTVTREGLTRLVEAGFNRISFGLQSADENELLHIGRPTSADAARKAVLAARAAGFTNMNLDLIYGLPGQTLESWVLTLKEAIALAPTHLSCYALTVEEKTRLHVDLKRGDLVEPDQELQNVMEDEAACLLSAAGFDRYEISNYSRPGHRCRHNLHYWTGDDYLGLGPSAQSYLNGRRFGNVEDLAAYAHKLEEHRLPTGEVDILTPEQRHREALVFGLRLIEGIDLHEVSGPEPDGDWTRAVMRLTEEGLLETCRRRLRLTGLGRRYADSVAVELL